MRAGDEVYAGILPDVQAMTPQRAKLWQACLDACDTGAWERISGHTIRYSVTGRPTPETIPARWWPDESYDSHLFLSMLGGRPHVSLARCPWVRPVEHPATLRKAREVLVAPEDVIYGRRSVL